jgi:Lar family restriction alleviation protein
VGGDNEMTLTIKDAKKCPFCGRDVMPEYNDIRGCVQCPLCEAEGPYAESEPEAILAWNTRKETKMSDNSYQFNPDTLPVVTDWLSDHSGDTGPMKHQAELLITELRRQLAAMTKNRDFYKKQVEDVRDVLLDSAPPIFNACNERCDNPTGPCACGASHSPADFLARVLMAMTRWNKEAQAELVQLRLANRDLNNIPELLKELTQAKADLQTIEHNVAKVYCHITNDLISKANTDPDVVIAHADDVVTALVDEEAKP